MPHEIRELLEFKAPSKVDTLENGTIVIRRAKYLGARSSNVNPDGTSNVYPLSMRQASEHLYEGAKLYADHPDRSNPGSERRISEQLGRLRGPFEHREDGSYADVHLNPKHPLAESIAWSAQHSPDDLGLSHNAVGRGRVDGNDCVIESAERVRSVDFVSAAATTRGLFESRQETPVTTKAKIVALLEAADERKLLEMVDEEALTAVLTDSAMTPDEKVMQALGLLVKGKGGDEKGEGDESGDPAEAAEGKKPDGNKDNLRESLQALQVKHAALEARLAAEETRKRRDALLEASRVPASETLRGLVRNAESDEQAKALIEEVKRAAFHQEPRGGAGHPAQTDQPKTADDLFARLI